MDDDHLDSDCFTIPFQGESGNTHGPQLRLRTYQLVWDRLGRQSQKIVQKSYSNLSSEVLNFVLQDSDTPNSFLGFRGEIPTALIIGGTPSTNSLVLENLELRIDDVSNVHASHIRGKECASLTVALRSLVLGFIGGVDISDDENEQATTSKQKQSGAPKLATHDLHLLEAWYAALLNHNDDVPSKLVVLFHDIEAISPSILEDLFYICGLHAERLPFVFIICLSTSPDFLHATLTRSALTNLGISRFHAAASENQFDDIIQGLFFDLSFQPDIMLGPDVLDILFNSCGNRMATLDALSTSLQLLLLEHCSHPLSVFTSDEIEESLEDQEGKPFFAHLRSKLESSIKKLDDDEDEGVRQSIEEALTAGDDASLLNAVEDIRREFGSRVVNFRAAFKLLSRLRTTLRLTRAKKDRSNEFISNACTVLDGKDTENLIRSTIDKIDKLSLTEVRSLLQQVYQFFTQDLPPDIRQEQMTTCSALVLLINEVGLESEEPAEEEERAAKKTAHVDLTRFEDVAALSQRSVMKSKHTDKIKNLLTDYLSEGLRSLHDTPLSEIWCLSARTARSVEHLRNPSIVSSITSALIRPQDYLQCQCCTTGTHTLPDESMVFLRYLDGGKMINVYDWFETFTVSLEKEDRPVIESPPKKGKGSKRSKKDDQNNMGEEDIRKELQARFLRCFHELDLLGFLKHTGRKQDHVMRTVFELNE
ncbi:hypothetical protein FRC02_010811 [Tulasnella sp. 418]|nr:hypothetical protein FRC02_010811 [Tulasnella sp. 418]